MSRTDFSDQFRKIIIRHKRIGYDLNAMRQSACLVVNSVTVNNFAALFNCTLVDLASMRQSACLVVNSITVDNFAALCTPVDLASDSMMAPT